MLRLDVYVIVNGSVSIRAIILLQKHILGFVCLQQGSSWIHMLTHDQVLMPELAAHPIPAGVLRLI